MAEDPIAVQEVEQSKPIDDKKDEQDKEVPLPDRRKPTVQPIERVEEPIHVKSVDKHREEQWRARRIKLEKKRKAYQVSKVKKAKNPKKPDPVVNKMGLKKVAVAGMLAVVAGGAMYLFNRP